METDKTKASWRSGISAVPRGVWTLGLVSMFMDISSEMIHSLLPVFLVGTLGASVALVGVIEGAAEATASITKIFSGWLSDRLGKRKLLAILGYGLGALSKPIFPLAVTPFEVFGARFADRIGKGVRGAPRDALVADLSPPSIRGAAFGVRQSLDTIGAFTGPLVAMALMLVLAGNIRAVFAWAVVPAIVAVLLLVFGVREPRSPSGAHAAARPPIQWAEVRDIGPAFWGVVALGVVFTMARFSEAFLVLRAQDAGLPIALIPVVMVVMNVVYSIAAAPAGSLSDRIDRRLVLVAGLACLVLADLFLALGDGVASVLIGVALWGLHMGLTQGLLAALVVDTAPAHLRGTAFGLFNLASGFTMLAASTLAGILWSAFGYQTTFLSGGLFASLALVGLILFILRVRPEARIR
ncbi:MFS transporter [Phenylobacterium aquaticum]|uniref:MFS transporter n=1 Tax=Phenylobacterium aquaticum TaxID=1763816 RepID=UPI001F5D3A83|nr:MFS transporter [Phenylobacterium aquaticum]MCI3132041.1 MFS transporter [Phenylobacterium aquaticum]